MARPFRHQRPDLAEGLVPRPDVQRLLAGRFDRRVTVVVAGAGFGKTTALVQAFEENRLRTLGQDVWLACDHGDADPVHFATGLGVALGLDEAPQPDELTSLVREWIGGRSPSQVCVVLDDVHLVHGSATSRLLAELIESMPANGHLVLSGRRSLDVPLTRLELIGQCVEIGEADLRLTDAAAAALLATSADDIGRLGGWPALIQLARRGRSTQFVMEEVVELLSDEQLDVLRALIAIGDADGELLSEVTGVAAASLLEEIPLVHRRGDQWGAHDLWSELVDVEGADAIRRNGSAVLISRGQPSRAVEMLLAHELGVHELTTLARGLRDALVDPDVPGTPAMRRWAERLRSVDWDHPARHFLDGLVIRLDNPGSTACHEQLQLAADGFLAAHDDAAAVAALSALCFAYHVRRDVDGLLTTFAQLQDLADAGVADARPFPLLGAGLVATAQGDPESVLEQTEVLLDMDVTTEIRAITLWLHANALCNLGRDAVAPARACYDLGLPLPGMAMVYCNARLQAGRIDEMLSDPIETPDGERDRFLLATWECVTSALLGDLATANDRLAVVESSFASETQWQTVGSVALPRAVVAYTEFRDDDAAEIVRDFVEQTPRQGSGSFYYVSSVGLLYPLLPELRDWYHELEADGRLGPFQQRDLTLTRAVTRLVEDGELAAIEQLALPATVGEMMPSLGARFGAVLLSAWVETGRDDAWPLVHDFVDLVGEPARHFLRRLATGGDEPAARGAKQILEAIPVAPVETQRVTLLGGTDLHRDGEVVDDQDWRRERVRALLTFLALHPDTTREHVIEALWPGAEPAAGRRNLRTTLNMLHAVLEPRRQGGDAPYFVRSVGQRLRLVVDDHLVIDVHEFERTLDEAIALDEAGTPSQSIEPYLAAVRSYRGDLLPDSYDDWVVFARDRLRARFVRAGVRAAELLLMTGRPDESVEVAARMLTVEPWSEPAHRVVIAAHLERGDVASARRSWETCERALEEIGGPSEPETAELRHRLAAR